MAEFRSWRNVAWAALAVAIMVVLPLVLALVPLQRESYDSYKTEPLQVPAMQHVPPASTKMKLR